MKEVSYETLSTAVRALSERITALDERIEVSLSFGNPVSLKLSVDCFGLLSPEGAAELAEHLGSAANLAKGFQYNGCTVRR